MFCCRKIAKIVEFLVNIFKIRDIISKIAPIYFLQNLRVTTEENENKYEEGHI